MRDDLRQDRARGTTARARARGDPAPELGHARRGRALSLLWLAALAGVVLGAGLAIGTNVSGAVLAGYGLVLAVLGASVAVAARRAARRRREWPEA